MSRARRKRVAVLISGRGSNLAALIAAAMDPAYPAEIATVIANRAEAPGLAVARDHGLATVALPGRDFADRAAHEQAVEAALAEARADIVCLAGYMRLLGAAFVERWQGRMINIHPSLLPLFAGLDTHARALAAGVRVHGCTVHFVTAEMDAGPIVAQAAVPVLADDDEPALAARVLAAEHRLYPAALRLVAEGKVRMSGARAVFSGLAEDDATAMLVSPGAG